MIVDNLPPPQQADIFPVPDLMEQACEGDSINLIAVPAEVRADFEINGVDKHFLIEAAHGPDSPRITEGGGGDAAVDLDGPVDRRISGLRHKIAIQDPAGQDPRVRQLVCLFRPGPILIHQPPLTHGIMIQRDKPVKTVPLSIIQDPVQRCRDSQVSPVLHKTGLRIQSLPGQIVPDFPDPHGSVVHQDDTIRLGKDCGNILPQALQIRII